MRRRWLLGCLLAGLAVAADYRLAPVTVGEGVYVFLGKQENFSRDNGGNIANTGFIVRDGGITVIDAGPSHDYGTQQRAAIARVSQLPVTRLYITHAHPDHFLGSQAYDPHVLTALPATLDALRVNGDALLGNMYRLVGGWEHDTQVVLPGQTAVADVPAPQGGVRWIAAAGHTDGDLMVYDERTRTLFAGDLVFAGRAPTTPNADIDRWLATLGRIDAMDFKTLVPGHGPVAHDHAPVAQTRDYLTWLRVTLADAAHRGLDMSEAMRLPLPPRFEQLAVARSEFERSVTHLYPAIEQATLAPVAAR